MDAQRVEVRTSRGFYALMLAIALVFVLGAAWAIVHHRSAEVLWIGVPTLLFFGAGVVLFVSQIVDRRPRLVIDQHGVLDRTLGVGLIPWRDVKDAELRWIQNNAFICLDVRKPAAWLQRMSPFKRMLAKANRRLGFKELNLNLSGVAMKPEAVLELVLERIAAERERFG